MIKGLLNWKLRAEVDRLEVFFWLMVFFTGMAQLSALRSMSWLMFLFSTVVWVWLTRFLYISFQRLYYTMWTLLVVVALLNVFLYFPISAEGFIGPTFFAILALAMEGAFAYLMFTPVYYPIVSWWEYDFRFRDEVKAQILKGSSSFEGRLSDLRRKAACLQSFEELNVGEQFTLMLPHERSFEVEVMSKRRPSLGRPTIYGVRFILTGDNTHAYELFCEEWRLDKMEKRKMKRDL